MNKEEGSEFRELLYYGMDNIIFYVNGAYFQINSGWENGTHSIFVYRLSGKRSEKQFGAYEEVFDSNDLSAEENIKRFFAAPLFDGKTFWEVEQDIEWVDD